MKSEIPEIVIKLRKKIADRSFQQLINEYYDLEDKIKRESDINKSIHYCIDSFPLIEPLIMEIQREYGQWNDYTIISINLAGEYFALAGMKKQLLELNDLVSYFEVLKQHRLQLMSYVQLLELADQIKEMVDSHPGYIQKDLYDALDDVERSRIDECVRKLERMDVIDRESVGDSYRLTIKIRM